MKRTSYIIATVVAIAISLGCFYAFFLLTRISNTDTGHREQGGNSGNNVSAEEEIASLEEAIAQYEGYLASKYLILTNESNPLPENIENEYKLVKLTDFPDIKLEEEAAAQLELFIEDARKDGIPLTVLKGFVSAEKQKQLYDEEYEKNVAAGHTDPNVIEAKTKRTVALPEYSEYRLGLAADMAQTKDLISASAAEKTAFFEYAEKNIYKYGFILRYPKDKESVTGFDFNPWHFRYIGDPEQAKYIADKNITLEEYIEYLNSQIELSEKRIEELKLN